MTITVVLAAYRRPHALAAQVAAIRAQSVKPARIWAFANDPQPDMVAALAAARLDRVVTSSENTYFHARFALAMTALSDYVALFDDDTIPGPNWFVNCLETDSRTPGILGTAGIVLHGPGYGQRTMHGWQRPCDHAVEVDLVGQGWFARTEYLRHLFAAPPVTGTNGEDIELAARAFRLAGVRSYCPPHPAGDRSRWGSTRGLELGVDEVAASLTRRNHEAERDAIVRAEMAAGWLPLFCRPLAP
ncbi:MAG TPA: glycosyltransferase, partial [Pirellulales bacterium]|nr:glycosyltransferase [Pirellulales bacterium]